MSAAAAKLEPEVVRAFAGKRVVVAGDLMLDVYVTGDVRRISPEAPVPVLDVSESSARPGGAANAALNVAALGGRPLLVGVVGADADGDRLLALLEEAGLDVASVLRDPSRPTTCKTRVVARSQQIVRLDREVRRPTASELEARLGAALAAAVRAADACVLSDYDKGVLAGRLPAQAIAAAAAAARPVVVDPKGRDFTRYAGATVVTPNTHELEVATGHSADGDGAVVEAGAALLAELGGAALLVTRGAAGMTLLRTGAAPRHLSTAAQRVYDVTGAGDTVVSALALALAAGLPLEQAMEIANRAAGVAVSKMGTAIVTADELAAALAYPTAPA
jgi:D-beta-D-heptose 7-phosphate kinase/D-beta-D-heptose 1-phosphate adenosyltransferase